MVSLITEIISIAAILSFIYIGDAKMANEALKIQKDKNIGARWFDDGTGADSVA